MSKLTIVANFKVKTDKVDFIKAELEKLVEPTRTEEGCLQYDLHHDNENPQHFMFYENWTSRDLWLAHMNAPHLKAFQSAAEGSIEEFTLNEMTHIC